MAAAQESCSTNANSTPSGAVEDGASSSSRVVIEKLRGSENYIRWRFQMQTFLQVENLWCGIVGFPPGDNTSSRRRKRIGQVALTKILSMIERTCVYHVKKAKTAEQAWEILEGELCDPELIHKFRLLNDIASLTPDMFNQPLDFEVKIKGLCQEFATLCRPFSSETYSDLNSVQLPLYYDSLLRVLDRTLNITTNELIITKLTRANVIEQLNIINVKNQQKLQEKENEENLGMEKNSKQRKINRKKRVKAYKKLFKSSEENRAGDSSAPSSGVAINDLPYRLYVQNSVEDPAQEIDNWYIDCGSTRHLTYRSDWLQRFKIYTTTVQMASSDPIIPGTGSGDIEFLAEPKENNQVLTIRNVVLMPQSTVNIISVCCLLNEGFKVEFENTVCTIKHNDIYVRAFFENKHFKIKNLTLKEILPVPK